VSGGIYNERKIREGKKYKKKTKKIKYDVTVHHNLKKQKYFKLNFTE